MSYRVDIPTLSANEVYTLTFEYEGTETIQLIVGDLTLETTDRRVVFTTTSPVNYIESNVNLINLNMYEGYYESDDFGGEYIQESYIEGKSLVDISSRLQPCHTSDDWNASQGSCVILDDGWRKMTAGTVTYNHYKFGVPAKDVFVVGKEYTLGLFVRNNNCTTGNFWLDIGHSSHIVKSTETEDFKVYLLKITEQALSGGTLTFNNATNGDNFEFIITILEGNYYDDMVNGLIQPFKGIGCVKSPKIVSRNEDGTEESIITTPDDLELHRIMYYDKNTNEATLSSLMDTVDLTTGIVNRNYMKIRLNDYLSGNFLSGQTIRIRNDENLINSIQILFDHYHKTNNLFPSTPDSVGIFTSATGLVSTASQGSFDGWWSPVDDLIQVFSNDTYMVFQVPKTSIDGVDTSSVSALKEWLVQQDFTIVMRCQPYTEQLPTSINTLKSYRNGSITTSSQQLAPTLKTTLPISNKFTTTNLTSGSTYNVYFDGTATKLDAGGTIITNPVSPCEVECGGTTLTIEGTDIQNVRVLETSVKNEVGSVSGTTDVELSRIITSEYENMVYDNVWTLNKTAGGASVVIDNDNKTIFSKGSGSWAYSETKIGTFPKGVSLIHVECDIEMKSGQRVFLMFGNGVSTTQYNFRDLKLNNDTATICQGNSSGVGSTFASFVTKGHFSNLLYVTPSTTDKPINLYILTSDSMDGLVCNATNCAEGSIDGYTICGADGVTISNIKIRVVENYPDDTTFAQHPSLIRQGTGQVIWQDMNMSMPQTISDLEQPIKLRSLGTTYDSYNPVTGELVKRIGVSETDGSYSVLSSPIVMQTRKTEVNGYMADKNTICKEYSKGYEFNTNGQLVAIDIGHYTDYYIKIPENTKTLSFKGMSYYKRIMIYDENKNFIKCYYTYDNYGDATGNITSDMKYVRLTTVNQGSQGRGYGDMRSYLVTDTNYLVFTSDTSLQTLTIPHLYTNGQVKVYSDSDVYPTTILNGQSTNNYEVNGLNKSNNYTIRYDGTCESINLANKSNEQGTNRIVKSGTDGRGNLTFVNSSGDINNVLLVEHDVREQEINYFTGLETVEVSGILIETSQNMWWNDWIAPSEYGASWQVDSPEFISVQPGETIYVVANNNNYTSLLEFDENYNIVNQGKDLILSNEANPKPVNLGNNYYKNYRVLSENTRYIKFIIPVGTATTAKNEARWSVISFTKTDVGNVPLYTNNTPYRGSIINLPQPVQLNRIHKENMPHSLWSNVLGQVVNLADGITYDSYNPITGEYIQRVYKMTLNGDDGIKYIDNWDSTKYVIDDNTLPYPRKSPHLDTVGRYAGLIDVDGVPYGSSYNAQNDIFVTWQNYNSIALNLPRQYTNNVFNQNACKQWLRENPITLYYELETPITTQLTPINIPTFEGGIVQLITTDGKVFPMVEYSMPTNNRYDTSSWEAGKVYTQRNMTEAYFNESTTPMIPTETMTLTTDHISSGSIILNDNGNGLIVLKGNYTGRDIPYFTGMRSVEAIEVETTPSPDQPLFGKGGRK